MAIFQSRYGLVKEVVTCDPLVQFGFKTNYTPDIV